MVIRIASNKNNYSKAHKNKRFDVTLAVMSRFLLWIWKFQQFARFNSTL